MDNTRLGALTPCSLWLPQNLTTMPWYSQGTGSRIPLGYQKPQCSSPYIKWHRTMPAVSQPHLWIPNQRWKVLFSICGWRNPCFWNREIRRVTCIVIEQHPRICGPARFRLLFKVKCVYILHFYNIALMYNVHNWQATLSLTQRWNN